MEMEADACASKKNKTLKNAGAFFCISVDYQLRHKLSYHCYFYSQQEGVHLLQMQPSVHYDERPLAIQGQEVLSDF